MLNKFLVHERTIKTSVQLMELAQAINSVPGVIMALVMQATPANLALLAESGFPEALEREMSPSDLTLAISAQDEAALGRAEAKITALLGEGGLQKLEENAVKSLDEAVLKLPGLNLALISVPGAQAVGYVQEALAKSLHVHLFSDNVSLDDERALKEEALQKGLLMMGPGCGTAIINQVPLGFANQVKSGPAGLVSAAGTGLQELSSLLSRQGVGISQAIGVGGRDLSREIGGMMMLAALEALEADRQTEVIALVSKPPHPEVLAKVTSRAEAVKKPVVLCLLGGEPPNVKDEAGGLSFAATIEEAAQLVRKLVTGKEPGKLQASLEQKLVDEAKAEAGKRKDSQKYLRGFYVGGTMCFEALTLLRAKSNLELNTNLNFAGAARLADSNQSVGNTLVDFGEEEFTLGRVHPMIDPSLRHLRLLQEARDPELAVLLLDFVLGYGSHPDPVGAMLPTLAELREISRADGREITIVASVVGTDQDPQNRRYSATRLRDLGVIVAESNAQATRVALASLGK